MLFCQYLFNKFLQILFLFITKQKSNILSVLSYLGNSHNLFYNKQLRHNKVVGHDAMEQGQIHRWSLYSISSHLLIFCL